MKWLEMSNHGSEHLHSICYLMHRVLQIPGSYQVTPILPQLGMLSDSTSLLQHPQCETQMCWLYLFKYIHKFSTN